MKVLEIKKWKPFTSLYPQAKLGNVEIEKIKYKRGYYLMEGVGGYELFYLKNPAIITVLKIYGEQQMVDDPLHYLGMNLLAKKSGGRILTAGLGLGLYPVFLQSVPRVIDITIVEINKNVIKLIEPQIRKFFRKPTRIINDNIFNYLDPFKLKRYDTIMLDIWSGEGTKKIYFEMIETIAMFQRYKPTASIYVWGLRDSFLNPAVKKVSEEYLRLVLELKRSQTPSRKDGGE